ncbi:MAG TPA: HNH endonuclease [bacterium]|nr:HNH endonuclease [bacterium]
MKSIKELLYIETEGSCANCGFKDNRALTIHHLKQSKPKNEAYDNKILLCHNCHHIHTTKKGLSDIELNSIKKRLIIKTLTRPGLNAMKEAYRHKSVYALPFLVNHLIEMGYLYLEVAQCSFTEDELSEDKSYVGTGWYLLTQEGEKLLEKWRLK